MFLLVSVGWSHPGLSFRSLQVKVLYVRNLTSDVTEEDLMAKFSKFGKTERVKKMKDYAFIHFEDRDKALEAMNALNGTVSRS